MAEQIVDRRRRNARERRQVTGSRWMPNAAMLCELSVPAGYHLRVSADDLRNMYHAVPGTWERACSTPCGFIFKNRMFKGWACYRHDLPDDAPCYIAWRGIGMGDHTAVDLAQAFHCNGLMNTACLGGNTSLFIPDRYRGTDRAIGRVS